MTSLDWWKEEYPSVTDRIGWETDYWLPTNLYMGANVSWEYGLLGTVVDEKIVNALGEWQPTWVVYLPPTYKESWDLSVTDTMYTDKDVGILLKDVSRWEPDKETAFFTAWLMDTNIDLGPQVKPSIKLSGELDYLSRERVKIKLTALVRDANTMEPVSGANVTMDIYSPDGDLWISAEMVERLLGTGIYKWESNETIRRLWLEKGLYVAHAQAFFPGGPTATDILEFHIDPPAENFNPYQP